MAKRCRPNGDPNGPPETAVNFGELGRDGAGGAELGHSFLERLVGGGAAFELGLDGFAQVQFKLFTGRGRDIGGNGFAPMSYLLFEVMHIWASRSFRGWR
jgi:hypothetical protein